MRSTPGPPRRLACGLHGDVFLRRLSLFGDGHRHGQDALVIGSFDVVFVSAGRQRDRADERAVRKLRPTFGFLLFTAFGLDRQLPITDRDVGILGRIDSGQFGVHRVPNRRLVCSMVVRSHSVSVWEARSSCIRRTRSGIICSETS